MRLLLDTHIFLWWLENPASLSKEARNAIQDGQNLVYISAAAIWEITIKKSLGKIKIPNDMESVIKVNRFTELPITIAHTLTIEKLPAIHRDPFDRIMIAQAIYEGLTLVSRDPDVHKYPLAKIMG